MSKRCGGKVGGGLAALALAGSMAVGAALPAHADGGVIGSVPVVGKYVGLAEQAYSMYKLYVLGQKPPSSLDQFRSLIAQSQAEILGQIDAIAAAGVQSCARTAVQQLP